MKMLLALDNAEVLRIMAFSLESQLSGVTIFQAPNLKEAILTLQKNTDVAAIICEGTDAPGSLVNWLNNNNVKTPVLVLMLNEKMKSGTFGLRKVIGVVQGKKVADDMIVHLKKFVQESGASPKATAAPVAAPSDAPPVPVQVAGEKTDAPLTDKDFCRINTNLLLRVSPLKADIFIRLSATKFVKLFQEGDTFDAGDLEKYLMKKKVDYFYLLGQETGEFVSKLKDDLNAMLASSSVKELAKMGPEISQAVHETVKEIVNNMGVTKEVQEVIKTNMQMCIKTMQKSPKLSGIIEKIKKDPTKYISSHSMMLGEMACGIATAAGWNSETTYYKLNLAAFLHDITLKSNELAAIQTLDELEGRKLEFTPADIQAYMDHPSAAAELAKQFTEVPPDVDVIIAQHHELPSGKGFPRGLSHTHISPLAATFIVAHDLLMYAYQHEQGWTMSEFLDSVRSKYSSGNFKKIIKTMSDLKG